MEVDHILDRVGVTPTHRWILAVLCLIEVLNGFQIVMVSIISPGLKRQWNLTDDVQDIPLSLYLGLIVGSLIAGTMADELGRKPALMVGLLFQIISCTFLIVSEQFFYFLGSLLCLGTGIGITLVTANALLSEQFPKKNRGSALLFLSFITIAGKFLAILFAYVYEVQNWRDSEKFTILCMAVLLVLTAWKVPESVRILLIKGHTQKAIQILSQFAKESLSSDVTFDQVRKINQWAAGNQDLIQSHRSYKQIFNHSTVRKTVLLSLNWFLVNFMFFGQLFIMPFIFQREANGVSHFAYMICGEIPSIFLTTNMIERENFGRKHSLALFFALAALFNFGLVYFENIVLVALSRLTMKCIFQILSPYTAESYPTRLRSHGLAFCGGVGRLGSILMPMLVFRLYNISSYLVFVSFMGASMIGLYSSLSGHETLNTIMDEIFLESPADQSAKLNMHEQISDLK